ncbi:unnamed protein product [Dibothriocephalus latus]|uniref:Tyrosine-protein phosphatase domain-containing protein n=1 Tax=Dibothriocephalus latus TaxID=60516 RepID=A0A3P7PIJ7_DIBLA|nr:unnamed protein product [Dibothriocephalus latus]
MTRVSLTPIRGIEGSDYINANYIDSYRKRQAYIATQGPMAETLEDFWRMIWEHNSAIIVMLNKPMEQGKLFFDVRQQLVFCRRLNQQYPGSLAAEISGRR